jgi:Xaa-Pro dipeptidase
VIARHGITLALVHRPENVCHLTEHETPGYHVSQCRLVPARDEPVLLMVDTETVNARRFSYLSDVEGYPDTVDPIDATLEPSAIGVSTCPGSGWSSAPGSSRPSSTHG